MIELAAVTAVAVAIVEVVVAVVVAEVGNKGFALGMGILGGGKTSSVNGGFSGRSKEEYGMQRNAKEH